MIVTVTMIVWFYQMGRYLCTIRSHWYGINYAGMQIIQWDFQNQGKSDWSGTTSFVLEVPLHDLCPSVI